MLGGSRAGVAPKGTVVGVLGFPGLVITHPPSCLPSLHRFMLPGFVVTMKALTSDLASPLGSAGPMGEAGSATVARLFPGRISLLISFELPTVPPPTTASPFHRDRFESLRHRLGLPRLPAGETPRVGRTSVARSRVRTLLGASPTGLAESSSLALRTGLSPQIALHLSSRKRSYHFRLQASNFRLTGTSTLLFERLHRRTRSGFPA